MSKLCLFIIFLVVSNCSRGNPPPKATTSDIPNPLKTTAEEVVRTKPTDSIPSTSSKSRPKARPKVRIADRSTGRVRRRGRAKITAEGAMRIAEEYIRANGYTDFTPKEDSISEFDIAERMNRLDAKEVLVRRKNMLRPRAYGCRPGGRNYPEGWTVGFELVKPLSDHRVGMAVTMDEYGKHVHVEHMGFNLDSLPKKP